MRRDGANGSKARTGGSGPDARLLMHEDEHAIVKEILETVLNDDDYFAKVARDRPESRRVGDRLALATFLKRIERQFALRPLGARRSRRAWLGPPATQR